MPPGCTKDEASGIVTCPPPPDCAGRTDGPCAPPPWCTLNAEGAFDCRPPEPGHAGAGMPGEPGAPMPGAMPLCQPGPEGQLRCAPPPNCGGTAFAGAGVAGCAPPPFCTVNGDAYDCKPPEDCRAGPGGPNASGPRCAPPPMGAACERMLQGEAANGAFVPCAPAPTSFCPPPPPGAPAGTDTCRHALPPLRFCAPGEAQFPPDHPTGTPPVCVPAPEVRDGQYRPPALALGNAGCAPPPPGEWPPAQPAPEGQVWCPPMGFAPPPANASDIAAWKDHVRESLPPQFAGMMERQQDAGHRCAAPPAPCMPPPDLDGDGVADISAAANAFGLFAPPQFDGRLLNGSFVETRFQEDLGLRDFQVLGTPFFREVRPGLQGNASVAAAAGNTLVAAHDQAAVEAHNVPSGLLAYRGRGDPFQVTFDAEGENATVEGGEGMTLVRRGAWTGVIIGDTTVNGSSINAKVDPQNPVFFMAIPPEGLEAQTRLDIAEGVAKDQVFAEISLVARDDAVAEDVAFYDDPEVFSVDVTNVTQDAITVDIAGEGEGEALVFTVDRETLTTPLSQLNVTIDGKLMTECASFGELAGSAAVGGCFHVVANETVIRVSVMPEHFSEHTIVIGAVETSGTPSEEPGSEEAPAGDGSSTESDGGTDAGETPAAATPPANDDDSVSGDAKDTPGVGAFVIVIAVASLALMRRRKHT